MSRRVNHHWSPLPPWLGSRPTLFWSFSGCCRLRPILANQWPNRWCRHRHYHRCRRLYWPGPFLAPIGQWSPSSPSDHSSFGLNSGQSPPPLPSPIIRTALSCHHVPILTIGRPWGAADCWDLLEIATVIEEPLLGLIPATSDSRLGHCHHCLVRCHRLLLCRPTLAVVFLLAIAISSL